MATYRLTLRKASYDYGSLFIDIVKYAQDTTSRDQQWMAEVWGLREVLFKTHARSRKEVLAIATAWADAWHRNEV